MLSTDPEDLSDLPRRPSVNEKNRPGPAVRNEPKADSRLNDSVNSAVRGAGRTQ